MVAHSRRPSWLAAINAVSPFVSCREERQLQYATGRHYEQYLCTLLLALIDCTVVMYMCIYMYIAKINIHIIMATNILREARHVDNGLQSDHRL